MLGKVNRKGYCTLLYSAFCSFHDGMSGGVIGNGRQARAADHSQLGRWSWRSFEQRWCELQWGVLIE